MQFHIVKILLSTEKAYLYNMNLEVSGFFAPAGIYDVDNEGLTLIHSSEDSFFELWRGERAGHFRLFKCLKQEYRGNLLHETMLQKEFEIGFPLRHPGIRETYAYVQMDTLGNCIEMEWIDGVTLNEFLASGALDESSFRRLAAELCDALAYLHSHQILHRDIKPSNILITHQGHFAKLIDFSLADSDAHVLLKQPAGTRAYAAPEVLSGKEADQSSDLYSLAKVFSQMTRRHRRVLARCTDADPARRYADAESMKEALLKKSAGWMWILAAAIVASAGLLLWQRPGNIMPVSGAVLPDSTASPVADTVFVEVPKEAPRPIRAKEDAVNDADIDAIFQQATELFD